jgi:Skp family chaperone for outer membrane proteins
MEKQITVNEKSVAILITLEEVAAHRAAEIAKMEKKISELTATTDDDLAETMSLSVIKKLEKRYTDKEVPDTFTWADVKSFKAGKGKSEWVEFLEENGLDKKEQDALYSAHKIAFEMYAAFSSLLPDDILKQKIGEAKAVATCKSEYKYLITDFLFAE